MTRLSDEIMALSDDYVLGLLSPAEATLMEAVIAREPELSRRVGRLRDQLLPLDLSADPMPLPEGFAAKVRGQLPAQQGTAVPSVDATPSNASGAPGRRALGLIAAAVAGLALGVGLTGMRPLPAPTVVAVLVDADGVPQAVIDDYGNDTATVRFVADVAVPADRTLQVWTLPSQDLGPISLGTLDRTAPAQLRFADLPDPGAQQLYEVTLEPLGGSPTGRPTGPIIGKGFAAPQA
ncbi:Anti-sigma-K factor RskA [Loktanella atrilutea]|uniref:Anti-sigma-K factor RskA n=1 Tax=Loktanella atrilutea TaxID=366533 RepID=A0A1M4SPN9_LOKAT|nr:anti-sigma factor [Loktanella atrilutea]SHE34139.1 Anti-sigma-K factor RskA [Loktanella atrilutea]